MRPLQGTPFLHALLGLTVLTVALVARASTQEDEGEHATPRRPRYDARVAVDVETAAADGELDDPDEIDRSGYGEVVVVFDGCPPQRIAAVSDDDVKRPERRARCTRDSRA